MRDAICELTQEEVDNLSRSISVREIESIISDLPKQLWAQMGPYWILPNI